PRFYPAWRDGPPHPGPLPLSGGEGVRELLLQLGPEFLDLGEEAFGLGTVLLAFAGILEFLQQLLLALGQMHGRLDHDLGIHVAALMGAQHAHAFGAQAKLLAGLGPGGNGDARPAAVHRGHLDDAAQRRRGHGDGDAAVNIGALALKQLMGRHGEEDVEIAPGRAAQASLALARQADAGPVLHPRRDGDVEGLVLAAAALAAAGAAGLVDDLAAALAAGAGRLDGEEALGMADLAAAAAGRAGDGLGALLRPAAGADVALAQRADADRRLLAREGLL